MTKRLYILFFLGVMMIGPETHAADSRADKKNVLLWYDAFSKRDPALLDRILSKNWVDIPPAPDQPSGSSGARQILVELTTAFPDLGIKVEDVLQENNKVIVRSKISGTQRGGLMGFPAKNRNMSIQAIDIHEFKDGKIVRTWHTEDWMSGFTSWGFSRNKSVVSRPLSATSTKKIQVCDCQ
jgi:steroid delta-isomerase-like uncharacterized protein